MLVRAKKYIFYNAYFLFKAIISLVLIKQYIFIIVASRRLPVSARYPDCRRFHYATGSHPTSFPPLPAAGVRKTGSYSGLVWLIDLTMRFSPSGISPQGLVRDNARHSL